MSRTAVFKMSIFTAACKSFSTNIHVLKGMYTYMQKLCYIHLGVTCLSIFTYKFLCSYFSHPLHVDLCIDITII